MNELNKHFLNQVYSYSKETGELLHKEKPREMFKSDRGCRIANSRMLGKSAVTRTSRGYMVVKLNGMTHYATKIIGIMSGVEMDKVTSVKFKDKDKSNLAFDNLLFLKRDTSAPRVASAYEANRTESVKNGVRVELRASYYVNDTADADAILKSIKKLLNVEM